MKRYDPLMKDSKRWAREELLVAFNLYCKIPYGKFHSLNPDLMKYAARLGRTSSALAMKLGNIASLDPVIRRSGRKGLSSASKADKAMWEEMQADWEEFAVVSDMAIRSLEESKKRGELSKGEQEKSRSDYTANDNLRLTKTRQGQGLFKAALLSAYNYRCCVTGLSVRELLIASHIIPWSKDKTRRLDPSNGLLLSALQDKAFDRGLMTITEDMKVQVSQKIQAKGDEYFMSSVYRFNGSKVSVPGKFEPDPVCLAYHRKEIYERWT